MATRKELLAKIQKLLSLSRSDNLHEAALAAARAQEIMERHAIAAAELEQADEEEMERSTIGPRLQRRSRWQWDLAKVVAEACGCAVAYMGASGTILVVGRKTDVEVAGKIRAYCHAEVDSLTAKFAAGQGSAWGRSFRLGCVAAIGKAIEDERAATRESLRGQVTERALVVVDGKQAEAERALGEVKTVKLGSRPDMLAFATGVVAGRHVWTGTKPRVEG
jgi:hypothetical protein